MKSIEHKEDVRKMAEDLKKFKLLKMIKKGNTQAIITYLKKYGRDRGYVE